MPLSATYGFDTGLANNWINSGAPIELALRSNPTISVLFGPAQRKVKSVLGKSIPYVDYSAVQRLDTSLKELKIPYQLQVPEGQSITRSSMLNAPTYTSPDQVDALTFLTTFYESAVQYTTADVMEGKGKSWDLGTTFEQTVVNNFTINYFNRRTLDLFATGANRMPGDGVFGSLRAQISDGLTATQRGIGGSSNESDYVNFLGASRVTSPQYQAYYQWNSNAAFSLTTGVIMGSQLQNRGAQNIVCPMNPARFAALVQEYRQSGRFNISNSNDASKVGGKSSLYDDVAQVTYYMEPKLGASTWLLFIDLNSVTCGSSVYDADMTMFRDQITTKDSMKFNYKVKDQVAVFAPHRCGLLEGLSLL
jgi:hypothetical protein